jgi:hypothetical protein
MVSWAIMSGSKAFESYGIFRKFKSTVVQRKSWKAKLLLTRSDFVAASLTTGWLFGLKQHLPKQLRASASPRL